jgi:hypothetical protein
MCNSTRNRVVPSTSVPIAERFPWSHDQIALPVPGLHSVFDRCGTLVNHRHGGQPSPPLNAEQAPSATTPADGTREADRRVIDRLIDRLGAQPPRRLSGEEDPELVRDLLRAPALAQQPGDELTQHAPLSAKVR